MKKKIISIFTVMIIVLSVSFNVLAERDEKTITVKGALFTNDDTTLDISVSFDFDRLTESDSTVFDNELAMFLSVASFDAYYRDKDEGTSNENKAIVKDASEDYDCTLFLRSFGFENVRRIETYDKTSTDIDKNDSATFMAGHRSINGKDVFIFVFRGSFSSGEWLSAFDVGDPSSASSHPNWKNTKNLKSIDVAANAAYSKITDYIAENGSEEESDFILLSGHSRGGAIANVLGSEFEDDTTVQSCTYTFSCPKVTVSENAADYKTVFNINNSDDFFEDFMPFGDEKLVRYGVDISDSFSDNPELISLLEKYTDSKYICMSEEDRSKYAGLFGEYFKNRTDIFKPLTLDFSFETEDEATEKYNDFMTVISGFKLDDTCSAVRDGNTVSLTTTNAALLKSYSMVLAYGTPDMVDYVKTLFPDDEIASLLYDNLAGVTSAHRILKSYVLSEYLKSEEETETSEEEPSEAEISVPEEASEAEESCEESVAEESSEAEEISSTPASGDSSSKYVILGMLSILLFVSASVIIRRNNFR